MTKADVHRTFIMHTFIIFLIIKLLYQWEGGGGVTLCGGKVDLMYLMYLMSWELHYISIHLKTNGCQDWKLGSYNVKLNPCSCWKLLRQSVVSGRTRSRWGLSPAGTFSHLLPWSKWVGFLPHIVAATSYNEPVPPPPPPLLIFHTITFNLHCIPNNNIPLALHHFREHSVIFDYSLDYSLIVCIVYPSIIKYP